MIIYSLLWDDHEMWCPVYVLTLMHDYLLKEIFMLGKQGVTDIIRGSEDHQKLEDWKLQDYVKCCFWSLLSLHKHEATANSEDLEGIGCLSIGERQKKDNSTIVQLLSPLQ